MNLTEPSMKKTKNILLFYLFFTSLFLIFSFLLIFTVSYVSKAREASLRPSLLYSTVVVIDPGHGGEDSGAIGVNGALEKDVNLEMSKRLCSILSNRGITCILTRSTDTLLYDKSSDYQGQKKKLDMEERLRIVRSYRSAVFISIHQNSFPSEKYSGFAVYYSPNHQDSYLLAKGLEEGVRSALQNENDRVAKPSDGNIYLLDQLNSPAVLLECGFLSNREECAALCSEEYQAKLCLIFADCIEEYINLKTQNGAPAL